MIGRCVAVLLALICVAGISCESQSNVSTGGETHFLKVCDPSAEACGTDFSCICNVCTRPCDGDSGCADLPGALCAESPSECGDAGSQQMCEVPCLRDSDCSVLSDEHHCESRVCRLGDAVLGTGGDGNAAGGAPGDPTCETGTVSANELVILGDSFFATSHQITAYLEDLARSAGVLQAGDRYQDKSTLVLGNALALDGQGILAQYESAVTEVPVKVVVMNGGGADVLLGTCDSVSPDCPLLVNAAAAFDELLVRMASDGVTEVVYLSYPDPLDAAVLERMNALRPLLQEICVSSELPCHFVDLRPVFEGKYEEYILMDGLNPTAAGSQASATAIWEVMQQECIAQ